MSVASIYTERLELRPLDERFFELCLANERTAAERYVDCTIDAEWYDETFVMELRRGDLAKDPSLAEWLLRGVVLSGEQRMIGDIGFHTRPGAEYLRPHSPGVEFGYTIFSPYRRRGFAREASLGLMEWAYKTHGVQNFVASVSPNNVASLRLIAGLGFVKIGSHEDEIDGPEDIYELQYSALAFSSRTAAS